VIFLYFRGVYDLELALTRNIHPAKMMQLCEAKRTGNASTENPVSKRQQQTRLLIDTHKIPIPNNMQSTNL
jgi:hypothetical protein